MLKLFAIILFLISMVHLIIIVFVALHYKKYNPGKLSISRLGTRKSPYHKLLNLSGFIFGLSVLSFGMNMDILPYQGSVGISIIGIVLTISSLFPFDRFPKIHDAIAGILGFLCVIFSTFSIHYIYVTKWLPDILIFVIFGIILCSGMLVFEISHKVRKQSYPKYTWYWEWGWLGFELLFIFIICISILKLN